MFIFLILILSFFSPKNVYADGVEHGSGLGEGDLKLKKYSIIEHEVDVNPSAPAENEIKLFVKDKSGVTTFYTIDHAGTVVQLSPAPGFGGAPSQGALLIESTGYLLIEASGGFLIIE